MKRVRPLAILDLHSAVVALPNEQMSQLDLFGAPETPRPPTPAPSVSERKQSDAEFRKSMKYNRHIKSAQWRASREAMFKIRGKKCEVCGATTGLELHHKTYENFGRELEKDLEILCKRHHEEADRAREAVQEKEFQERCEATRDGNARHTFFTKVYGENYFPDESMHRHFDEWRERKNENEAWGGGYPEY